MKKSIVTGSPRRFKARSIWLLGAVMVLTAFGGAMAAERDVLRVCADPNSLPFSHKEQQGLENRIAEIIAADLEVPLEYSWFPQRRGFIRNTLRAKSPDHPGYKCDLVMGVPYGFELVITTKPYYRSTYALAFKRSHPVLGGLERPGQLAELSPEQRESLRIGVFERTPATTWLTKRGMHNQLRARPALHGDPDEYPGLIIERDLASDDLDAAIVWGPIAGYFAKRLEDQYEIRVLPLTSEPGAKFDFAISMGVRWGAGEWKDELEGLLDRNAEAIAAVLDEYNVPQLPLEDYEDQKREDDD